MTADEIKQTVTMRDVLAKYGVSVKNNMCCCPIHKERHPSMKVFKDGYKCFACGSAGDIFRFIQEMEGCDFKTAFVSLGGTYENHKTEQTRAVSTTSFKRKKEQKNKKKNAEKDFRKVLQLSIDICKCMIETEEPFSEGWCMGQRYLPWLWHVYETKIIEGQEVNEIDVFGVYRKVRQKFNTL